MYFKKFLERYFDVEKEVIFEDTDKDKCFPLERFELYEKGEDSEYMFSLTLEPTSEEEALERRMAGLTYYRIGNVYSSLTHNAIIEEKELRKIIKNKSYFK
jgi:hypothetical protein